MQRKGGGLGHQPRNLGGYPFGRELGLADQERSARRGERRGVGQLILIERVRQRHQYRRPADGRDLGHGRGARARDHQMAFGHARGQVRKESGDLRRHIEPPIDRTHRIRDPLRGIAARRGCANARACGSASTARGHHFAHHARTLAAAEHDEAERLARPRNGEDFFRGRGHRRPHRIADVSRLGRELGARRQEARVPGRDRIHPSGKPVIGPSHHCILLVDDAGDTQDRGGDERRQGRIAAEADDGFRPPPQQKPQRAQRAPREHEKSARQ